MRIPSQSFSLLNRRAHIRVKFVRKLCVTEPDRAAIHFARHAQTAERLKMGHARRRNTPRIRSLQHGRGKRVLAAEFEPRGQT